MEIQWKRKDKYSPTMLLMADGMVFKEVSYSLFKNCKNETISNFEKEKWFEKKEKQVAENYALKMLLKRNYPSSLIEKKLTEKQISWPTVKWVVDKLSHQNYVNDQEWIEWFIEHEFQKGHGPYLICQKLKQKNLSDEVFHPLIEKLLTEDRQKEKMRSMAQKELLKYCKNIPKLSVALQRRGFAPSLIREVFSQY